ncbi:tRNA (guanine-N(7)-)-methyltransferase [Spiroplasma helicoides]|uniref:tRNA (guanine-N(7)-)-methyltransferase n=1 Tax=Spiroplasma helicoides TaxID=216938 RepID=A0A1B3SJF3_9MOLU|nr:tRNA (guanosine(46)-N7)-methyltransferase TrmB [Spiroplasma helicoides]AOG60051.1 tRNA (guanine-N(7)-)-methyltransferase [Spiroplasma helicoides]
MRLRNKNWTKDFLEINKQHLIQDNQKININNYFKNEAKVFLEIGCGKGKFIINNAIKNLDKNFIAMEKETTVVGVALKNAISTLGDNFKNIKFLNTFAENLDELFEEETFDGIYLNFSDPWPKTRHYKKRLTYSKFLEVYYKILKKDGKLEIKTDNDNLYSFSLEQLQTSKFKIVYQTNDLYSDLNQLENNIATEYEEKFHSQNKNINKIIAIK